VKVSLEWLSDFVDLPAGVSAAELAHQLTLRTVEVEDVLQVDGDSILEIDNKSLTNRPDLWGHFGIAREFAAIYKLPLRPLPTVGRPVTVDGLVGSTNPELCTRFAAVGFDADGYTTPDWLRDRLHRIGEASVHPLVDLSNYVMFTVGQPTHVYDADRLSLPLSAEVTTQPGEARLLSGQPVKVDAGLPVIRDSREIVGIAGVIGGASTALQPGSKSFVLEAASFRPQIVRRASQRLGVRTEASARYEKGLDTQRVDLALDLFLHLLPEIAPQALVSGMQDIVVQPTSAAEIKVHRQFLIDRIGDDLGDETVHATLRALGFTTVQRDGRFLITVPTWRSTGDVSLPHDIVEEVARIYGYDRLAVAQLPVTLRPVRSLNRRSLGRDVREQLALRAGLQEVLTYPWTTDHLLAAAGFDKEQTVRFEGASAPDRDSLRPSLLPNLLETIASNLRYRPTLGIFEVGTVFSPAAWKPYRGEYEVMPEQPQLLGVALVGDDGVELFRRAKGILSMLRRYCHIVDLSLDGEADAVWADPSARLGIRAGGRPAGSIGLLTPRTRRLSGIEGIQIAYAEVDLRHLEVHLSRENRFETISELPETDFDLSVVVADGVPWAAVERVVSGVDKRIRKVNYVDEYRGSWVPGRHRSLTLRVVLRPTATTLTAEEIGEVRTRILEALAHEVGAHLRATT
jgi:phenylalanyl-tRNA synthetase beta chain